MLIKRKRGWELPESAVTSETHFRNRRRLMKGIAAGSILAAAAPGLTACGSEAAPMDDPSAGLYPAQRNMRYRVDRELTSEELATSYNNFYEFGSSKNIVRAAQKLPIRPWTVTLDGMVEKEQQIAIDDLLKQVSLEERVYRFRCVEAWAMTVPWTGFPMRKLVEIAKPLSGAKYVRMETFMDPSIAPGQKQSWYPWPYVDGLTMAEATHDLTLMATGIYGKPLPPQNGTPLRFITPWKYGFKQVKSIVRLTFTDERPVGYWEALQAREYGFWANVNPEVSHPRWSQATERLLGSDERVPTQLYNGYTEFVGDLYKGMEGEKLFM